MNVNRFAVLGWMLLCSFWIAGPAVAGPKPLANPPNISKEVTNAHFKAIGPGLFQLGQVKLNSGEQTVSFPAFVNMEKGAVEYLLVGTQGKLHESVLRTEVEPYHIHLGMLLLNAKGAPKNALIEDYTKPVPGDPIRITVSWTEQDRKKQLPAEDLVYDIAAKGAMSKGDWTYSGSRVFDGTFIAQRDRSIVAIIGDIDALVNNPRARRDNDENWLVNTNTCPVMDTPVQVTIQLQTPKSEKKASEPAGQ
jgi:hypothetical protein